MKYFTLIITTAIFLLSSVSLLAQHNHVCGLQDHELLIERLMSNKKYLKEIGVTQKDGVSYIPVKYHIIGRSDGSRRVSPKNVLDMHCTLNNFYAESDDGIQFYIKDGFNYIDNTATYEEHTEFTGNTRFLNAQVFGAINIFIPRDATPPNADPDAEVTVLGYYSGGNDWIVIRKADVNGASFTAPHEVGHFFSLAHPFNGWDSFGWETWRAANGDTNIAPVMAPFGNNLQTERVDGSNCETSGDFVCDTPPSYGFPAGCNYNGGAMDPIGTLVDPDELNVMDYFSDACSPKILSPDQKALVLADYEQRISLHTDWTPISETVTGSISIIQPADDSETSGFDHVIFQWDAVAGADRYLLEIDRLDDFSLDPWIQVVYGTQKDVWGIFDADRNYNWRVTPFNPYNTCGTSSSVNKFTTGTTTSNKNVLEVNNLSIDPNPVSKNNMVITLDTANSFDAEISIISITGQTLQTKSHHFGVGTTNLDMRMNDIPNGMYLVNIKSGDRLINKKIVVSK